MWICVSLKRKMKVQKKEITFFCILYELLQIFLVLMCKLSLFWDVFTKGASHIDEPFIICFDLKEHSQSNLLKFQ